MNITSVFEWGVITFWGSSLRKGDCVCVQGLNDLDTAVSYYKEVVKYDATNVEAIACIATHYFYSEQPEMALRFYRYVSIVDVFSAGDGTPLLQVSIVTLCRHSAGDGNVPPYVCNIMYIMYVHNNILLLRKCNSIGQWGSFVLCRNSPSLL